MIEKTLQATNRKILYFNSILFMFVTTINYFSFFLVNYQNNYDENDLFIFLISLLSFFISLYNLIAAKYFDYTEVKNIRYVKSQKSQIAI